MTGLILTCLVAIGLFVYFEARRRKTLERCDDHCHEYVLTTNELIAALRECEDLKTVNGVLLQEVQHRTKNNLQLLASLVSIQQNDDKTNSLSAREALGIVGRRISALARVHDLLHNSTESTVVSVPDFVSQVTNCLLDFGGPTSIHLDTDTISDLRVPLDVAGPLGLILCELVSNSIEHAYRAGELRPVWIEVAERGGSVVVSVEDLGSGLPEDLDLPTSTGTGLKIVSALVSQLNGTLEVNRTPHTRWVVSFPTEQYAAAFPRSG